VERISKRILVTWV